MNNTVMISPEYEAWYVEATRGTSTQMFELDKPVSLLFIYFIDNEWYARVEVPDVRSASTPLRFLTPVDSEAAVSLLNLTPDLHIDRLWKDEYGYRVHLQNDFDGIGIIRTGETVAGCIWGAWVE